MTLQLVICMDHDQDSARVRLSGQLDAVNSNSLYHQVLALIHGGHTNLELDLSGVEAAAPVGLGNVLAAADRARAVGGSLHMSGIRYPVQEVMEQIGIGRFCALCDDSSFMLDSLAAQRRASGPTPRPMAKDSVGRLSRSASAISDVARNARTARSKVLVAAGTRH